MIPNRRFTHDATWTAFGVGLSGVVVALLLLFATTPVCTLGMPWLPQVASGDPVAAGPADLLVSIARDGSAFVVADVPRAATLEEEIRTALAVRNYDRIVIQADRRTKLGALEPVFRAARAHGVPVVLAGQTESVIGMASRTR